MMTVWSGGVVDSHTLTLKSIQRCDCEALDCPYIALCLIMYLGRRYSRSADGICMVISIDRSPQLYIFIYIYDCRFTISTSLFVCAKKEIKKRIITGLTAFRECCDGTIESPQNRREVHYRIDSYPTHGN